MVPLRCSVLCLCFSTGVFAVEFKPTSYALRVAVSAWCDDPVAAEAIYGHISEWDTSRVRVMAMLFKAPTNAGGYCSSSATFNEDISCWDTGAVVNMYDMFTGCASFNQPIISWDTSKVTNMAGMFYGTSSFNQPLAWDVSQVTDMEGMFEESAFNQEIISGWDVSSVLTMDSEFFRDTEFSYDLCWDLSGKDTEYMFSGSAGASVSPDLDKCACTTGGTYYDGSACSTCPPGQFGMGQTESCSTCPPDMLVTPDKTSCYCIPKPTPGPTPEPSFSYRPSSHPVVAPTATPLSGPAPTPMPSSRPAVCFHGDGLVTLESGELRPLSDVEVGESILTTDVLGNFSFSPVLSLPHKQNSELVIFLELATDKGKRINLTPDHLLPRCGGEIVTARSMAVGDCILTVDGRESIKRITSSHKAGVYTAITENKFIVVDQVVASPFGQDRDTERAYQREQRRNQRQLERRLLRRTGAESSDKRPRANTQQQKQ